MTDREKLPVSEELLHAMRSAVDISVSLREPFVSPKALLLALLDDAHVGAAIARVVERRSVLDADVSLDFAAVRRVEDRAAGNAALPRYDTLQFKTRDGRAGMWLSREAFDIFVHGAKCARGSYLPADLVRGFAAQAALSPAFLSAVRVEPGRLLDALAHV